MTFFNVSIVVNADDDGYCVTFDNAAAALACAEHATAEGAWFVNVWAS
jgi:hypothetical protein